MDSKMRWKLRETFVCRLSVEWRKVVRSKERRKETISVQFRSFGVMVMNGGGWKKVGFKPYVTIFEFYGRFYVPFLLLFRSYRSDRRINLEWIERTVLKLEKSFNDEWIQSSTDLTRKKKKKEKKKKLTRSDWKDQDLLNNFYYYQYWRETNLWNLKKLVQENGSIEKSFSLKDGEGTCRFDAAW